MQSYGDRAKFEYEILRIGRFTNYLVLEPLERLLRLFLYAKAYIVFERL